MPVLDLGILLSVSLETWLFITVVLLILTVLAYLIYSGILFSVQVSTSETQYGPMTFAYKTHIGPYKNVGEIFTGVSVCYQKTSSSAFTMTTPRACLQTCSGQPWVRYSPREKRNQTPGRWKR